MITPPSYAKDAVPTRSGWKHPKTGELLKAQNMTQEQIDEYNGVQSLNESPTTKEEFVAEHIEEVETDLPAPKKKKSIFKKMTQVLKS